MKKVFSILTIFLMLFAMSISAFAIEIPETLPNFPYAGNGIKNTHDVVIYSTDRNPDGEILLYRLQGIVNECYFTVTPYNDNYVTYSGTGTGNVQFKTYKLYIANNTWVQVGSTGQFTSPTAVSFNVRIDGGTLYTNHKITDSTGNTFFPLPTGLSAERIMALAKTALATEKAQLNQTVLILVLCGVGCLTLLISSVLLVKVFRRYQH